MISVRAATITAIAISFGLVGCVPSASPDELPTGTGGAGLPGGTGGGSGGAVAPGGPAGPGTGGMPGSGGAASGGSNEPGDTGGTATGSGGASGGAVGDSAGRGGAAGGTAAGAAGGTAAGAAGGTAAGAAGGTAAGGATGPGCPSGALFCEGFEAQTAGAAPGGTWTPTVLAGGQITVDTSRPFSGQKALHVTGMMNSDKAYIQTPLAITATTIFVRFMMYTAGYPSSSGVHTRLLRIGTAAGTAAGTAENSYSLSSYNGTAIEKVNSIYLRDTGTHFNDAGNKNRWICWEFEIDKTGGAGKVTPHIWVDGRQLSLSVAGSATHGKTSPSWDPIPIEVLVMGLDGFQPDPVRADFWIDDLVVNSQRVGCPAAAK